MISLYFLVLVYSAVAAFSIYMSLSERGRIAVRHRYGPVASVACCLAWPIVFPAVYMIALVRPATFSG